MSKRLRLRCFLDGDGYFNVLACPDYRGYISLQSCRSSVRLVPACGCTCIGIISHHQKHLGVPRRPPQHLAILLQLCIALSLRVSASPAAESIRNDDGCWCFLSSKWHGLQIQMPVEHMNHCSAPSTMSTTKPRESKAANLVAAMGGSPLFQVSVPSA